MLSKRENEIINFVKERKLVTSSEETTFISDISPVSLPTVKRILSKLVSENMLTVTGQGRGTRYSISTAYEVLRPIDMEQYYEDEIDEREIKTSFNWELIRDVIGKVEIFSEQEHSWF